MARDQKPVDKPKTSPRELLGWKGPITCRTLTTHPESPVSNSQPAGIGCLASIDDYLIVNNLGRNFEIVSPESSSLTMHAVFRETLFPDQDEPSQFDLDIHTFVKSPCGNYLLAVNHHGLIRAFPYESNMLVKPPSVSDANCRTMSPVLQLHWPGDVERFLSFRTFFISSSSLGYAVKNVPLSGILISESWNEILSAAPGDAYEVKFRVCLQDWGPTSALSIDRQASRLIVAAGCRVGIFDLLCADGCLMVGACRGEIYASFHVNWIDVDYMRQLIFIGGYEPNAGSVDANDWDLLGRGGLTAISSSSSEKLFDVTLDTDLAWGNGGVPVVLDRQRGAIIGVDRSAGLHAWRFTDGTYELMTPGSDDGRSLGIGHLCRLGNSLFCGFNRGDYQLYRYDSREL